MSPSAASRDASWYNHPDTHSFKVVHVDNGDGLAACNQRMPLSDGLRWPAAGDVPEKIRCRRKACADAYSKESPDDPR